VQLHSKRNDRCTCGREDCERPGRHPRTEDGIVHPTTDAAILREKWTQRPHAACAVATGAPNIIAVTITRENVNAPQTDGWPARPRRRPA
jgi:hypothetical protein